MTSKRQALLAAVGRATQAYQRATDGFDDEVGRKLGLNSTDLRCLDWLTEGGMTAGELAEATGLSSAATTSLLDRLERRDIVRRERGIVDRRKVVVRMTPEGQQLVGSMYGPLARDGSKGLTRFTDAELEKVLEFLGEATELVDRHRRHLRSTAS
jgi:DNA-binding MarR family transcriptional regulator